LSQSVLAVTLGDPAGIGPEIVVKAWAALKDSGPAFVVIGDADALAAASRNGRVDVRPVLAPKDAPAVFAEALPVLDTPLAAPVIAGQPSAAAAPYIIRWIELAVGLALAGEVSGIVTAPIEKAGLYSAGFKFPGHTEFIGELTLSTPQDGARGPIMMLTAKDLRVALVTIHEPLARISSLLTIEKIVNAGLVTAQALARDFGIGPGWRWRDSIRTPAKAARWAVRRSPWSARLSVRSGTSASTPAGRNPPTACSTRRRGPPTTPSFASTTTRR